MSRVQLPGFSIELPRGSVIEDGKNPAGGTHTRLLDPRPFAGTPHLSEPYLEVLWLTQSMTYEYFGDRFLPAMAAHQPNAVPGERVLQQVRVDDARWMALYGTPQMPIGIGHINCGPEFSVSIKLRLHSTVAAQMTFMRRIMDSVRCAERSELPKRPSAAVQLDAGFGKVPHPIAQLYRSLGGEEIGISFSQGDGFGAIEEWRAGILSVIEMELGERMRPEWSTLLRIERPDLRSSRLLRVDVPGDSSPIYFGSLHCEAVGLLFLVNINLPRANDRLAERRLAQIGCPGDATREPPAFDEMARIACASGDARGCAPSG